MALELIPSLDLLQGQVVRLVQGDPRRRIVYEIDPLEQALRWAAAGARWLHVVHLDGAFGTGGASAAWIARLVRETPLAVQLGGGLRTLEDLERAFELGVERAVVGTMAVRNPDALEAALARFGADRLVLAVEVREGKLAIAGWREMAGDPLAFAREWATRGVQWVLYTNVLRDGTLAGPDLEGVAEIARATGVQVMVSGGVGDLSHIEEAGRRAFPGLAGLILGRALHERRFTLEEAIARLRDLGGEDRAAARLSSAG
ncbi:MAG: 1-(5-phosphoribosyl)-5-[(5-phosphoribosylamino)methylideneamino] imidazole-4-carboxamide isomerase [Thermoflexus sp.]|uniref:1-(5-phosphoribosyl)-5-[(5- phosphoribosylamino)methylideneamino]imidazole-4- carboxamide isomerase n=1 Tax=Thermoflexus sp. TaxID=1969742 RepID=UPI0025FF0ACD|nr:1-(5-phosphoribosyl)-5-[(5-phosphoribosylamino)methylideneamino] imidazole-4-carboxamide isomerase [Thermoflexus sp.]MCS6962852.1 1-(5-phosphoribosyl)-5-[(5-phosphoribosylamino)methylideneamino] imidazole-4-carboxamide isomerase [Thermoflexus sp.]MDW8185261.1 1-(5-phosphoribosyl)-5-[(5-phosphoribosylamino)methylideneamino] imidazole-4-carboxamide isomerase [Anaerolineae bacterium]